jgi:hypothetical protein
MRSSRSIRAARCSDLKFVRGLPEFVLFSGRFSRLLLRLSPGISLAKSWKRVQDVNILKEEEEG